MLVLRCTARLLDKLSAARAGSPPRSTTRLGDWYATLLPWRPRNLVLLVNATTRVPVIVPARPLSTLASRVPAAIAQLLLELGLEPALVDAECREMEEVVYAKTASRSVLGTINELTHQLEVIHGSHPNESEQKLGLLLGEMLVTVPPFGFEFPGEVVQRLFDSSNEEAGPAPVPPAPGTRPEDRQVARVFQLKIVLNDIEPPVWRRIQVRSDVPMDFFHRILQVVMGWSNVHLHEFCCGRERIGPMEFAPDIVTARESMRRLGRVLRAPGDRLHYLYDPGDVWSHDVVVERVLESVAGVGYPRVLGGERACPPEDCGGPQGYERMLDTLMDAGHPDHADVLAFVGADFDPEAFDTQAVNAALVSAHLMRPRPDPAPRSGAKPRLRLVR
jgi:pRiA4b ORF-3-like protein/uncharacterized protein DUF6933